MNKTELRALIEQNLKEGTITYQDLHELAQDVTKPASSNRVTGVLYAVGMIIALLGTVVLLVQSWSEIGFVGRLLVTLGAGLGTYVAALRLASPDQRVLSGVFFAMSAVLLPLGAWVVVRQLGNAFDFWPQVFTAGALGISYVLSYQYVRRNVLVFLSAGFFSWVYFSILSQFFIVTSDIGKWAIVFLGASYLCLGYVLQNQRKESSDDEQEKRIFMRLMYAIGISGVLAPMLAMGKIFDILVLVFIVGAFYLSMRIRSRIVLALSSLFLVIAISKITFKYFAESISWPIALIFAGFCIIAVGYAAVYLGRKITGTSN